MIKRLLQVLSLEALAILIGLLIVIPISAIAVSVFITGQGGTGTTTPSGILYGDNGATTHLNTVVMGSGCTFVAGTLSCSGGSGTVGSGTQGQVPFYNSNGTTLTATSSIFIAQSGNIGMSTTAPFARLSIAGRAGSATNIFAVSTTTSGNATSTALAISNNGNLRFFNGAGIDDGYGVTPPANGAVFKGNVGIGVSNPTLANVQIETLADGLPGLAIRGTVNSVASGLNTGILSLRTTENMNDANSTYWAIDLAPVFVLNSDQSGGGVAWNVIHNNPHLKGTFNGGSLYGMESHPVDDGYTGVLSTFSAFEAKGSTLNNTNFTNHYGFRGGGYTDSVNGAGATIADSADIGDNAGLVIGQSSVPTGDWGLYIKSDYQNIFIATTTATTSGDQLILMSKRTNITAGSLIGGLSFGSNDTSNPDPGYKTAAIQALANQTQSATLHGTDLAFFTTPTAANSLIAEAGRFTANGFLGIGTTSPSQALSVLGSIFTTGGIVFGDGTTQTTAASSQWTTNGTSIYYNTGNVGIGTSTPAGTLHIAGSGATLVLGGNGGETSPFTVKGFPAVAQDTTGAALTFDAANGTGAGGSGPLIFRTAAPITTSLITLDATSTSNSGTGNVTTLSDTHVTGSGSGRFLTCSVQSKQPTNATTFIQSMTYGGVAMSTSTTVISGTTGTDVGASQFYLINPTSGSGTVTVTTAAARRLILTCSSWTNVNQTSPIRVTATNSNTTGTSATISGLASATYDVVVDAFAKADSTENSLTLGAGQTLIATSSSTNGTASSNVVGGGSYIAGAASVSTSWTWPTTNRAWAIGAISIKPTGNGTSNVLTEVGRFTSSGLFGLSTSTPSATFSVQGNSYHSGSAFFGGAITATSTLFVLGNVGIGTTSPSSLLHLSHTGTVTERIESTDLGIVNLELFRGVTADSYRITTNGGILSFQRSENNYSTLSNALTLTNNDQVGIGTTTINANLTVGGIGASTDFQLVRNATGSYLAFGAPVGVNTSSQIGVNGANTLTLTSAGLVGVGSTTPYADLSVHANRADTNIALFAVASSTATATTTHFLVKNDGTVYAPNSTSAAAAQTGYWCYDANGQFIRDSAVCLVSARKYKKDIQPIDVGLTELMLLKPVTYFKKDPLDQNDSGQQMGFIADDSPDARLITHDSNGDVHGFRYDQLTALIVKSIQDQQTEIENLKVGKVFVDVKRSAEENWQDFFIGLLAFGLILQQMQIKRLRK